MTVLDDNRVWDGRALKTRHIFVALSPAGKVDPHNPLTAGSAAGDRVHVYPKQLSPFLNQIQQEPSRCRVVCCGAAKLH
jgi:hypothetical protein